MFRNAKQLGYLGIIAAAIGLFCTVGAQAKKPPKPPADDDPVTYTMVELSNNDGRASAVTSPPSSGLRVVVIRSLVSTSKT